MRSRELSLNYKELQPLIRHCWEYNIYTKRLSNISFKEKFINFLILDGKKSKAYKLFNQIGILIRKKIIQNEYQKTNILFGNHQETILKINVLFHTTKTKENSFYQNNPIYNNFSTAIINRKKIPSFDNIIIKAIENVKPSLEVRKVRIAGMTYLVPARIPKRRQQTLAIKWIIESARKRKRKANISFAECLANEVIDAFMKQGQARQKRDDLHKLALANRAYTRYRWW